MIFHKMGSMRSALAPTVSMIRKHVHISRQLARKRTEIPPPSSARRGSVQSGRTGDAAYETGAVLGHRGRVFGRGWLCTVDVPDPRLFLSTKVVLSLPASTTLFRQTVSATWMLDTAQLQGQPTVPTFPPTLADLSRNTSVISSSSDSETSTTTILTPRPRPTRTFSSPRSRSPHSPNSHSVRPPPAYLTRELGVSDGTENRDLAPESVLVPRHGHPRSKSRKPSRSQNPSANTRLSAQDFVFGDTLGEGSYSTVRTAGVRDCCRGHADG